MRNQCWKPDTLPGYTSKVGYDLLYRSQKGFKIEGGFEKTLSVLWKSAVPFRIKAFAWKFFLNRMLTGYLLIRRGIDFVASQNLAIQFYF